MKKQSTMKTLATALGAVLVTSLVSIPAVGAHHEHPFGMTKLSDGFMVADRHMGGTDAEKPGMEAKGNKPGPGGEPTRKEMMGTDAERPGAGVEGSKLPRPPSEISREDMKGDDR